MGALDRFSGDGTQTPLTEFLFPISYEAAAYAYFGSSFPAKQSYDPFVKFDDSFTLMLAGLPKFLFKKNYQVCGTLRTL
jgi:cholesterol 7alpha-monooxygenase